MAEQTKGDIEIDAAPAEVMDVITDYPAYPKWASGVRKAEVKNKDKDGGLSWTTVSASGAVKDIKGEYALEPSGKKTKVTFRTTIEPAIPMMGFMKRQAEK